MRPRPDASLLTFVCFCPTFFCVLSPHLLAVKSDLDPPSLAAGTIVDVNVNFDLDHTCTKDLSATLISPEGTSVELFDLGSYPFCSSDMESTTLDDDASTPIANGSNPFTGSYMPSGTLSTLNGQDSAGVWTLMFYDDTIGDTGTLQSWSIDLVLE